MHLYATNQFNRRRHRMRSRYDFLNLQITDGTQPAQLLLILQIQNFNRSRTQHFGIVRYLMPENITALQLNSPEYYNNKIIDEMRSPVNIYIWEYEYVTQGRRRFRNGLVPCLIDMSTVVSNAFVAPYHCSKNKLPVCRKPKYSDKFWYIDRKFFDRSGWDTVNTISPDDYTIPGVPNIFRH